MKTILIPTDFSATAENAIEYSLSLFGTKDTVFILLNTYSVVYTPPDIVVSLNDVLAEKSRSELSSELEKIKELPIAKNAVFETISEYGTLVDIMSEIVRERHLDYVVMGTHGVKGLKEFLFGSNAASAALNLKCPLLIVPERGSYKGLKKIVFAADYKHIEDAQVLQPMISLARNNDSRVTILNILDKGKITNTDQALEGLKLQDHLKGLEHDYDFDEDDDKARAIYDFLTTSRPDMLTILRRKLGFFESLFHKSITRKMAYHTHIPLLVLHE